MPYPINLTNDALLTTVSDGTKDDTSTSLVLIGRNFTGYGEFIAENFVHALENSANITAPPNPLIGQLWFDTVNNVLKVANNTKEFKTLGTIKSDVTEPLPAESTAGDMWYDVVNEQVNVFTGSEYILVGGTGVGGSSVITILDNVSAPHSVTTLSADGQVVAVINDGAAFVVNAAEALVTKFPAIVTGLQLAQSVTGGTPVFQGLATDSQKLDGTLAADFLRSNANDTTSGTLGILNDGGLSVGTGSNGKLYMSGSNVVIENSTATGNIFLQSNGTPVITIDGLLNKATVANPTPGSTEIANANYVDNKFVELAGDDMSGLLRIQTDAGLHIGASNDLRLTMSGADATLENINAAGDIFFKSNGTSVITIDGGTNKALVSNPTAGSQQIATANYVDGKIAAIPAANTIVGVDQPGLIPMTVQAGTTGVWTTHTVNANARFAFVSAYCYGIFTSGGGKVIAFARKPGLSGAAGPFWEVARTGSNSNTSVGEFSEVSAGAVLVECNGSGQIDLYAHQTGAVAPSVHMTIKGWIE